jgi:hypothetical protein
MTIKQTEIGTIQSGQFQVKIFIANSNSNCCSRSNWCLHARWEMFHYSASRGYYFYLGILEII